MSKGGALTPGDRYVPTEYEGQIEPNYYCRGWNAKRGKYCKARSGYRTDHIGFGRCWVHGGATPITHGMHSKIPRGRVGELIREYEALSDAEALRTFPELARGRALFHDWIERYSENTEALLAWYASYSPQMRPISLDMALALETVTDELEALIGPSPGEPDPDEPENYPKLRRSIEKCRTLLTSLKEAPELRPRKVLDISAGHQILSTISQIAKNILSAMDAEYISRKDFYRITQELARVVEMHNSIEDPQSRLLAIRAGWLQVSL